MRSVKWIVLRGAPLAAVLSPLIILHSAGALTDSLQSTELRLAELIQGVNVDKDTEPTPVADAHGPIGRPLNMEETPVSSKLGEKGILLRKIAWVKESINDLEQAGQTRKASLMKNELGRALRMPEFADTNPAATRKMMSVLGPLFRHVERERVHQGLMQAANLSVEALYRASGADVKKHGAILPGRYYFAEGNAAGFEQLTPISLPANWTSYAGGASYIYFCTTDGLYSLDRDSGAARSLWYPGNMVPKHIAIDGEKTYMLVRGAKDYRYEFSTGAWTVLDSMHLPAGPVGLSSTGNRIYIPGRVDDGLMGYIHEYDNNGVLYNTIKLRQPIVVANRDALRVVARGDDSEIAFITENSTGARDIALVNLDDGKVVHTGRVGLNEHVSLVIR